MIYMKDFPNIFLPSTSSSSWWWGRHCCIIVHMERAWLVMQVWKIFTVGPPAKIFSVKLQNIFSYHHSQYPITPISDAELLLNSACSIWCRENFEIHIPGCVLYWTAFKILQCEVPFKKNKFKALPFFVTHNVVGKVWSKSVVLCVSGSPLARARLCKERARLAG